MNKKISLGVAIMFMCLAMAVTIPITMLVTMGISNSKMDAVNERQAAFDKIDEINKIIRKNYNGEIDETVLLDSISEGFAIGIGDAYAEYYTAAEYSELKDDLNGKVVGIGVSCVKDTEGYARIISVFPDSPAEVSGIEKGDQIVKVAGIDVLTNYVDAVLCVVREDYSPMSKIRVAIEDLSSGKAEIIGCIYNSVSESKGPLGAYGRYYGSRRYGGYKYGYYGYGYSENSDS